MPRSTPEELLRRAGEAARNAYAPYSRFPVGAALETDSGEIFSGCNVENASYGLAICGERNAIFAMIAAGHRKITQIAITADGDALPYPCGACRQVIQEFADPECPVHVASLKDPASYRTLTLGELLPNPFTF